MKYFLIFFSLVLLGPNGCQDNTNEYFKHMYGTWKLTEVTGGFAGMGHDLNFNYLKVDKKNDYKFITNDIIVENGKIVIVKNDDEGLLINFEPNENSDTIMVDSEKYVLLDENDKLNLNSPCCDRYNYHFEREE